MKIKNGIPVGRAVRYALFPLLWVLSLAYAVAVKIKYRLYKEGVLRAKKLPVKVICVGNLTAGGTGKTTTVIYLAKTLAAQGYSLAVLTRGYKRRGRKKMSRIISDGKNMLLSVDEAGDEAYLLAKKLPGVPVIIGSSRFESGKLAVEKFNPQIILMDDGFQHWGLIRDADIVLIDCLRPFGGERLLPLGFLREPLRALRRARLVILTHCNLVEPMAVNHITGRVKEVYPGGLVVKSAHTPVNLRNFISNEIIGLDWLKGKKTAVLSSIGNPLSFELTIRSLGAEPGNVYRFLDHHWYKSRELNRIFNENQYVLTTPKDSVRIELLKDIPERLLSKLYVLNIELKIAEGDSKWLKEILP